MKKIKYSKNYPNAFGIAEDILVVGKYKEDTNPDNTVRRVLKRSRKENLKFNIDKCHYRFTGILFFEEIVFSCEVQSKPYKLHMLIEIPSPKSKK